MYKSRTRLQKLTFTLTTFTNVIIRHLDLSIQSILTCILCKVYKLINILKKIKNFEINTNMCIYVYVYIYFDVFLYIHINKEINKYLQKNYFIYLSM